MPNETDLPFGEAFEPGMPLAAEIESLLDEGPLDVDSAAVDAAVDALSERLGSPPRRRSRALPLLAVAAVLLAAWMGVSINAPEVEPMPQVATSAPGLQLSAHAAATTDGETLSLVSGEVIFVRDDTVNPPVGAVRLTELDLVVTPFGTLFAAGADSGIGAVAVAEGEVLITHGGIDVARVSAGDGVVVWDAGDQLVALPPSALPDAISEEGSRLIASLRWSLLPEETRKALGGSR